MVELTKKFREPRWLAVVLNGDENSVQEDEEDYEPIKTLGLHSFPDEKSDELRKKSRFEKFTHNQVIIHCIFFSNELNSRT